MTPGNLGHKTIKLQNTLSVVKVDVFFSTWKNAHRDFEKGALNDSSISLILSFWEQIVFLKTCEKALKVSKLNQFWAHPRWS